MAQVRIGVVGCGAIATLHHIPNLKRAPGAEVLAVADKDESRAEEIASRFKIPQWYVDHRELLDQADINTLVVCTPTKYHAPTVLDALKQKLNVFCEKPMCLTLKEADEIVESVARSNSRFMVGYNLRFSNLFQKVKEVVSGGGLGELIQVECSFCVPGPKKWPAVTDFYQRRELGGGALFDSGSHAIDLLRWIVGEIVGVSASISTESPKTEVDQAASLLLRFSSGAIGVLNTSWTSPWPVVKVELYGTEGLLFASFPENVLSKGGTISLHKYRGITFKEGLIRMDVNEKSTMYRRETLHFLDCVRSGTEPSVSALDGRAAVAVTLAAYESARKRKEISI